MPSSLPTTAGGDNESSSPSISLAPTTGGVDDSGAPSLLPTSAVILPEQPSIAPSIDPDILQSGSPTGGGGGGDVTLIPTTSIAPSAVPTIVDSMGNETSLVPTAIGSDDNVTLAPTIDGTSGNQSTIVELIEMSLTDDGSLTQPGTPQNDALVATEATTSSLDPTDPVAQQEILQRYSLNTLYFATGGATWANNELWTTESNPCGDGAGVSPWFGVMCDGSFVEVQFLSLPNNTVAGTLPSEIRGLSSLTTINFQDNQLSGAIPSDLGDLTLLTVLEAGRNFFSSPLPPSIGNLTSLDVLSLPSNFIPGNLPTELGQLQVLRNLQLQGNFLTGFLPSELFSITSLSKYSANHFD
jgi:hypothetical protein